MKTTKVKIPTILGIIVLIAGLAIGMVLISKRQIFAPGATGESKPQDVKITNISGNSATISWITNKASTGSINWGESNSLGRINPEDGKLKFFHSINIDGLVPQKIYYFNVFSAETQFDNNGVPWQFTTASSGENLQANWILSGSVLTPTSQPAKDVLVYINSGGMSPISSKTTENGSWVISLSSARNQSLSDFFQIDQSNTLLEIFIQGGPFGVAAAKIYPKSANPSPPIILGQTFDFRNEPENNFTGIPDASLNLPQTSEPQSKFNIPANGYPQTKIVTIENVDDGEVITTTNPEFFGKGPDGTIIDISVQSELISDKVKVSKGAWKWSPPKALEEGIHKITVSWKDQSGILRTSTRTFIVQAAEGPSFVSTPSASPTSSAKPSPAVSPSPTPKASASPTPSSTPKISPSPSVPSSPTSIPDSGSLTTTYALSIMGVSLFLISIVFWSKI